MKPAAGLWPSINLTGPTTGSVSADAAGKEAVMQSLPSAFGGDFTLAVSGLDGTAGNYTVEVILNAAIENEAHNGSGPTNNTVGRPEHRRELHRFRQRNRAGCRAGRWRGQNDSTG